MNTFPIVSQLKSLWDLVTGDVPAAVKVQQEFVDAWVNHPGDQLGAVVDSVPVLGHVKGVVHLLAGDKEKFWKSEEAATRTLVVLGAGAATVSTGGAAAPILAGVAAGLAYDAAVTGVESARHGTFDPQGYIGAGSEIAEGDWRDGVFDAIAVGAMDGVLSKGTGSRTTKIYRVEGEKYVSNGREHTWQSNERLFRDGDGVRASSKGGGGGGSDNVRFYPKGNKGDGTAVLNLKKGEMLFLNAGDGARADAYYAQRVVQYHDAVNQIRMNRRPSHLTHNMKIKTFRVMTREVENLQQRSITEAQKRANAQYDGVLRVDITKARGQYGCERRVYTPLLRNALKGSYKEYTPWIEHLPIPVLRLIQGHQVAYGCVRLIFVQAGNPAFLVASLPSRIVNSLQPGPNNDSTASAPVPLSYLNDAGVRSVNAQDIPVRGLRQARHAKCGREIQAETDHGHHFEYLAEHVNGTRQWYPSILVADDLKDEFEKLSMSRAKEVAEVISSQGDTLTVRRPDGSEDKVRQAQLFWAEEDPGDSTPLNEEEIDAILHHWHYGRDYTIDGRQRVLPLSSVAVTAPKLWNMRVFYQSPDGGIIQSTHENGWTGGPAAPHIFKAKLFTPLGAVSFDDGKQVRVYYLDEQYILQEYCYTASGGQSFVGALGNMKIRAATKTSIAAMQYRDDQGALHIRVYYQELGSNAIRELCNNGPGWFRGETLPVALDGSRLAAVAYLWRGLQMRLYYQAEDLTIKEHCFNDRKKWFAGDSFEKAPEWVPISAFGISDTGNVMLQVYRCNDRNEIVRTTNTGSWGPLDTVVGGLKPGAQFAVAQWDNAKHVKVYYQGPDDSILERCNDGGSWFAGTQIASAQ